MENIILSELDSTDRKLFLDSVQNKNLTYRDNLGFDDKVSFGFEIEFENMQYDFVNRTFEKTLPKKWHIKTDETLNRGGEITTAILTDNLADWYSVKSVCKRVREIAKVGVNTGSHIHIGTQVLGSEVQSWLNFMKLWSVYENIIFRFCYGEYLNARPNIEESAIPVADIFWECSNKLKKYSNFRSIVRKIDISRYLAVNTRRAYDGLKEKSYNTIEFRCPNGTLNEVIWQNNLNLFVHLLLYAKSSKFDEYKIEKRKYQNRNIVYNIDYYNQIETDMAFELADLIFDTTKDKLYFLRQYFKSFEVNTNKKRYVKARTFTDVK